MVDSEFGVVVVSGGSGRPVPFVVWAEILVSVVISAHRAKDGRSQLPNGLLPDCKKFGTSRKARPVPVLAAVRLDNPYHRSSAVCSLPFLSSSTHEPKKMLCAISQALLALSCTALR